MKQETVIEKAVAAHRSTFGTKPDAVAWAPGRIEVLGNHTDYNEGTVLSAAINLGHCFCISRASHPEIRLFAVDVDQTASFDLSDMESVADAGWASYVKGVFYYIQEALGTPVKGLDCTFFGSIPLGAGLSSSAALEVAAAYAVLDVLGAAIDKKEIALLCRQAEHRFAGTNCGLLDQFSSIFGQEHGLIHTDFRSLEVSAVELPDDIEFLVINPQVKHSLSDSPYNGRRARCEEAAAQLNELLPQDVTALRDVSWDEFESSRDRIDPQAAKRAAHVVGEITRVGKGVELLSDGGLAAFGQLLFESHQSSMDNFENSCPELDVVVDAARDAGVLGARLSGGGFGGCAIVMIRAEEAAAVGRAIVAACQAKGLSPEVLEVTPAMGAHLIN